VRDATPARPAGGGKLDSKRQDVAAHVAGDALRPVALGAPEGADVAVEALQGDLSQGVVVGVDVGVQAGVRSR
jgi:hypothetical protein